MPEHPIETLMKTAMESIRDMVDVNTVVGEPIETSDGQVIVPISRVAAGFAAGGSEYDGASNDSGGEKGSLPFGGGCGAAVSVQPVGFLVVGEDKVRLLPVDANAVIDRVLDVTPQVLEKIQQLINGGKNGSRKERQKEKGNPPLLRSKIVLRPEHNDDH